MGLDQYVNGYDDNGEHIVDLYYRKINWLRNWIINNTKLTHDSNCEEVEIPSSKIKELVDLCNYVLEHKEEAENKLPILKGCFFGIYDYSDWYFDTVKEVRDDMEKALEHGAEQLYYEDWW